MNLHIWFHDGSYNIDTMHIGPYILNIAFPDETHVTHGNSVGKTTTIPYSCPHVYLTCIILNIYHMVIIWPTHMG